MQIVLDLTMAINNTLFATVREFDKFIVYIFRTFYTPGIRDFRDE